MNIIIYVDPKWHRGIKIKLTYLKQVYGKSIIDTLNKVIKRHRIKKERENSRSFFI